MLLFITCFSEGRVATKLRLLLKIEFPEVLFLVRKEDDVYKVMQEGILQEQRVFERDALARGFKAGYHALKDE